MRIGRARKQRGVSMRVPEESFRSGDERVVASPGPEPQFASTDGDAKVALGAETLIDPVARARELIALGPRGAYSYARQRQWIARTAAIAGYWALGARIVDDHIHKHAPLDIATPKLPSAGRMLARSPKLRERNSGQIE